MPSPSGRIALKNYFVSVVDGTVRGYPIGHQNGLSISREQYTELLLHLSEFNALDELLKCQFFSCGKCRSFSVSAQLLYSILKKIERYDDVAEIILCNLRESTNIEPWYFELLDLPDEMREKILGDDEDYYDMRDTLKTGNFIIEDEVVYQFPYEECSFVFDANCDCNRILGS